jgi:hypothetical protein
LPVFIDKTLSVLFGKKLSPSVTPFSSTPESRKYLAIVFKSCQPQTFITLIGSIPSDIN